MSAAFRFVFVLFSVCKLTAFSKSFPPIQNKWASIFFWYQDKARQLNMEITKQFRLIHHRYVSVFLGVQVFSFEANLTEVWHLHSSAGPKIIEAIPKHVLM